MAKGNLKVTHLVQHRNKFHRRSYRSKLRHLVQAGCHINSSVDTSGNTALHTAIGQHKTHTAIQLIRLGANVRAKNNHGETPLQLAVLNKSCVDPLQNLIPNGDRYNEINFYGMDSVRIATVLGSKGEWIQQLADQGKVIDGVSHKLVKMLLFAGADVNAKDEYDCSPIQCAVYTGDLELVKALIDVGADMDNRNRSGATALHDAVLCCDLAMVQLLLSQGINVDAEDSRYGETALHWAVHLNTDNSHEAIIRKLMEFGSDLNHGDVDSQTPFYFVIRYGNVDLVRLFINEYKADLKLMGPNGSDALIFAAENEDERVMDLVLESGFDINQKCEDMDVTPLHQASGLSLLENVRRLISRGADVNAKDSLGKIPLQHCIAHPHGYMVPGTEKPLALFRASFAEEKRQVLRLLLECGADVNNKGLISQMRHLKMTILEFAFVFNDIEAWKMIIEYAAEFEARTSQPLFDEHNIRVMSKKPETENYYQKCRAELTAMRTTKIENSFVSHLSVLTQHLDVVSGYMRNDEIVRNLQVTLQTDAYPIYASQLKKKFDAALVRRKTIEQVTTVLSETLQFADLTILVLENIFKYLNERDVSLLIGSA